MEGKRKRETEERVQEAQGEKRDEKRGEIDALSVFPCFKSLLAEHQDNCIHPFFLFIPYQLIALFN